MLNNKYLIISILFNASALMLDYKSCRQIRQFQPDKESKRMHALCPRFDGNLMAFPESAQGTPHYFRQNHYFCTKT